MAGTPLGQAATAVGCVYSAATLRLGSALCACFLRPRHHPPPLRSRVWCSQLEHLRVDGQAVRTSLDLHAVQQRGGAAHQHLRPGRAHAAVRREVGAALVRLQPRQLAVPALLLRVLRHVREVHRLRDHSLRRRVVRVHLHAQPRLADRHQLVAERLLRVVPAVRPHHRDLLLAPPLRRQVAQRSQHRRDAHTAGNQQQAVRAVHVDHRRPERPLHKRVLLLVLQRPDPVRPLAVSHLLAVDREPRPLVRLRHRRHRERVPLRHSLLRRRDPHRHPLRRPRHERLLPHERHTRHPRVVRVHAHNPRLVAERLRVAQEQVAHVQQQRHRAPHHQRRVVDPRQHVQHRVQGVHHREQVPVRAARRSRHRNRQHHEQRQEPGQGRAVRVPDLPPQHPLHRLAPGLRPTRAGVVRPRTPVRLAVVVVQGVRDQHPEEVRQHQHQHPHAHPPVERERTLERDPERQQQHRLPRHGEQHQRQQTRHHAAERTRDRAHQVVDVRVVPHVHGRQHHPPDHPQAHRKLRHRHPQRHQHAALHQRRHRPRHERSAQAAEVHAAHPQHDSHEAHQHEQRHPRQHEKADRHSVVAPPLEVDLPAALLLVALHELRPHVVRLLRAALAACPTRAALSVDHAVLRAERTRTRGAVVPVAGRVALRVARRVAAVGAVAVERHRRARLPVAVRRRSVAVAARRRSRSRRLLQLARARLLAGAAGQSRLRGSRAVASRAVARRAVTRRSVARRGVASRGVARRGVAGCGVARRGVARRVAVPQRHAHTARRRTRAAALKPVRRAAGSRRRVTRVARVAVAVQRLRHAVRSVAVRPAACRRRRRRSRRPERARAARPRRLARLARVRRRRRRRRTVARAV
eukprot:Rhum_TRINITY_DN14276_c1_g1::Rhum_TRINITY_DN14276_c1_g1_i1::g.76606::m.76606